MPQPTPLVSILAFVVAAVLGAVGQFLYKSATDNAEGGLLPAMLSLRAAGGMACYAAVMVLFMYAFKKGGAVAVLYPIYASTFIWAAVIAYFANGRAITPMNAAGMLMLVGGMYLLGR